MEDCLFCKIAAGEIPSSKVYEDDVCYAFNDIDPQAPVHFLVVPKAHMETLFDMPDELGNALIAAMKREIVRQFGEKPLDNPNYGKIVNQKHFDRLCGLLADEKDVFGGETNARQLRIAPAIIDHATRDSAAMQDEIFGPILPVLTFENIAEVPAIVAHHPTPLALYLFTSDRTHERMIMNAISFGGGCVNDTIIHLATSQMGFGGVGMSGMGSYHGKYGFDTFTHEKSIVDKGNWLDLPMRYQRYTPWKEKLLKMFLR